MLKSQSYDGSLEVPKITYIILMPIGLLNAIAVGITFYRRRHFQPIRARPVFATLVSLAAMTMFMINLFLLYIVRIGYPCIVNLLLLNPMAVFALNVYLSRIWTLWFKYKSTQQMANLRPLTRGDSAPEVITTANHWYLKHRFFGTSRFLYVIVAAKTLFDITIMWSPLDMKTVATERVGLPGTPVCPSLAWNLYAYIGILTLNACIIAVAVSKFGPVSDGFFLKQELKFIFYMTVVGIPAWIVVDVWNPSFFPLDSLFQHLIIVSLSILSGWYPIYKSYHMPETPVFSSSKSYTDHVYTVETTLAEVLRDPERRDDFREHLKLEFSVENLLLWEAVEDFKASFDVESPEANRRMCDRIMERFIEEGAELWVNISAKSRRNILENGQREPVPIDAFEMVQTRIFRLMARDSFVRFKKAKRTESERAEQQKIEVMEPVTLTCEKGIDI